MTLEQATLSLSCGCTADLIRRVKKPERFEVKIIAARPGCHHQNGDTIIKEKKNIYLREATS